MAETVSNVYQFKITLKGRKPAIWRRIQVPEDYSFFDLHAAIINAMGWGDCHLHDFTIRHPVTRQTIHIGKPMDEDDFAFVETIPEQTTKIAEYFLSPKDKATYMYDFGDGWTHDVLLEKILPATADVEYPKCLAGKNACPPEDCGGVSGYEYLLEILANPQHEEYTERKEWMEGLGYEDFDPEKFDPASVCFEDARSRWKMDCENGVC